MVTALWSELLALPLISNCTRPRQGPVHWQGLTEDFLALRAALVLSGQAHRHHIDLGSSELLPRKCLSPKSKES